MRPGHAHGFPPQSEISSPRVRWNGAGEVVSLMVPFAPDPRDRPRIDAAATNPSTGQLAIGRPVTGRLPIGRDALAQVRSIIAALPAAVFITDRSLICLAANERFVRVSGAASATLLTARPLDGMVPAALVTAVDDAFAAIRRGQAADPAEVELSGTIWQVSFGRIDPSAPEELLFVMLSDVTRFAHATREAIQSNDDLRESLRRVTVAAETDSLTGLPNRLSFEATLTREIRRSRQLGTGLTVALIDIDFFKSFNDTYGHVRGDECLARVARALAEALTEPGDFIARFGGEEFVCILPDARQRPGGTLLARLGAAVADLQLEHAASPHRVVTVSIGAYSLDSIDDVDTEDQTRHALLQKADDVLYAAKESGRNTSLIADSSGFVAVCRPQADEQPAAPDDATEAAPSPDPAANPQRRRFTVEEKLHVVMVGLRDEKAGTALCIQQGIPTALYAAWILNFIDAGRARLSDETVQPEASASLASPPDAVATPPDHVVLRDIIIDLLIEQRRLRQGRPD